MIIFQETEDRNGYVNIKIIRPTWSKVQPDNVTIFFLKILHPITSIKSPLTNGLAVKIAEFQVSEIIKGYKEFYAIDVSKIFVEIERLDLYKCLDSGYEFYYPLNLSGNDEFYRQLAVFDWYYIPWKWEHEKSVSFAAVASSILEIGCGVGSFLKNVKQKYPEKKITGLEITVDNGKEDFILNQTIEEHVLNNEEKYDLVCFYQVLEHIAQPKSFLESSIKALKPGGKLIISVPNNDTIFLRRKGESFLNMPPHHMGLWKKGSLEYLTQQFPLELTHEFYEPIQDYHFEWFKGILKNKIKKKNLPLSYRISGNNKIMNAIGSCLRPFYNGHSIMFVYKKN